MSPHWRPLERCHPESLPADRCRRQQVVSDVRANAAADDDRLKPATTTTTSTTDGARQCAAWYSGRKRR